MLYNITDVTCRVVLWSIMVLYGSLWFTMTYQVVTYHDVITIVKQLTEIVIVLPHTLPYC